MFVILISTSSLSLAGQFSSPTKRSNGDNIVTAAFGEYPHSGARAHAGYDFRAYHGEPLYAVVDGIVQYKANNSWHTLTLVPNDNSKISAIKYLHAKNYIVPSGTPVKAGQLIGYSGGFGPSGNNSYAAHLHFQVEERSGVTQNRAIVGSGGSSRGKLITNSPFGRALYGASDNTKYAVDPYPYFGIAMKFKSPYGRFATTKELYEALNQNAGTKSINIGEAQKPGDDLATGINNPTPEQVAGFLFENSGTTYGGSVEVFEDDEDISFQERLIRAATFRFNSENWTKSITSATNRALYADYVAANGLEVFLKNEIQKKRNHIEALFATLASQKIKDSKKVAIYAFKNSLDTNISNQIK